MAIIRAHKNSKHTRKARRKYKEDKELLAKISNPLAIEAAKRAVINAEKKRNKVKRVPLSVWEYRKKQIL